MANVTGQPTTAGLSAPYKSATINFPTSTGPVSLEVPVAFLEPLAQLALRLAEQASERQGTQHSPVPRQLSRWRVQLTESGDYYLRMSPVGGGQFAVWTDWEALRDMNAQITDALRSGRSQ